MLRAEIISVGTELLLGQIVDTDAAYLSRVLAARGVDLLHRVTVGDNFDRVVDAVRAALSRSDIVFTIGGLGPTEDDLTKEAVAEATGIELVPDAESEARIRAFFQTRGYPMTQNNLKQALAPKVGRILRNDAGTAPGAIFELDGKAVVVLPGPPGEFTAMVDSGVIPYLEERGAGISVIKSRVLRIVEIGESAVEDRVKDLLGSKNPTVAPLAHFGEVHLRITAKAETDAIAEVMIAAIEEKLRDRLGDAIFGVDDQTIEQAVVEMLIERNLTLGLAESCTGGLVGHRITQVPGSSKAFMAGVISYSNQAKMELLEVPAGIINEYGAVSHETAIAMARGARRAAGSDIGIGITGIAGPEGGSAEKPVGLVHIALSAENGEFSKVNHFIGNRSDIKARSAQAALVMLRRYLLDVGKP